MLKGLAFYQGICHNCQMGYYYPGGDAHARIEDSRPLKCAVCKFRPKDDPNRVLDGHVLVHAGAAVYIDGDGSVIDLSSFEKEEEPP